MIIGSMFIRGIGTVFGFIRISPLQSADAYQDAYPAHAYHAPPTTPQHSHR